MSDIVKFRRVGVPGFDKTQLLNQLPVHPTNKKIINHIIDIGDDTRTVLDQQNVVFDPVTDRYVSINK